jgi:hypothetical protein
VSLEVSAGAAWRLYSDADCEHEIEGKAMALAVGENIAYILVTAEDGSTGLYAIAVLREDAPASPPAAYTPPRYSPPVQAQPDFERISGLDYAIINENVGVVAISGKEILSAGSGASVKSGLIRAEVSRRALDSLDIVEGSSVKITVRKADAALPEGLRRELGPSPANDRLLSAVYQIGVSVDGKEASAEQLFEATIDASAIGALSEAQRRNFTAILYEPETQAFQRLGGEFNEDGSFTFYCAKSGLFAFAVSEDLVSIKMAIGDLSVEVNGQPRLNDVAPVIVEDRTLLPVRVIAEALSAKVSWIEERRTVVIESGGARLELVVGEPLEGGLGTPVIMSDRTYVPVRYISERLGANVAWIEKTRGVNIYK